MQERAHARAPWQGETWLDPVETGTNSHESVSHARHARSMSSGRRAHLADAAKIVAEQVDDHEVLGLVLLRGGQRRSSACVRGRVRKPARGALDGLGLQQAVLARPQEALRRGAADLPAQSTPSVLPTPHRAVQDCRPSLLAGPCHERSPSRKLPGVTAGLHEMVLTKNCFISLHTQTHGFGSREPESRQRHDTAVQDWCGAEKRVT